MSSRALALTLAITAIILVYIIILTIQPYPTFFKRHVDPNLETERLPHQIYLTTFLTLTFDELVKGNFTGTLERLKIFNQTHVPSTLKYVFERFRQLVNDLTIKLNDTDSLLDYAELLIDSGKEDYARSPLNSAGYNLAEANITYSLLKTSADEFVKSFPLSRTQIFQKVDNVETLLDSMHLRLYTLIDRIEFQKNLKETFLEIRAYPENVWVGSTATVEGKLYTNDTVLSQKNVIIYFEGQKFSEILTSSDGTFSCTIKLPYIYKPKVNVVAKYFPEKDDRRIYKPTVSNMIQLNLLYISPKIEMKILGKPLPGKYFTVEGKVYAESSLPYDRIKISWLTSTTITKLEDGIFKLTLNVPETLADGKYLLKAEAPSSGVFAPTSTSLYVSVLRFPLNITLDVPQIAISGMESHIAGKIVYEGEELFNSTIKFVLAQEYSENCGKEFTIKFTPPITMFSGYQMYKVQVTPQLPWYSSLEVEGRILIINPITVAVPFGLVSAVAVKVFRQGKRKGVEVIEEEIEKVEAKKFVQEKEYHVKEELKWLIDMYWQAVVIVSNITRIEMKPSTTIREYLNLIKATNKELYNNFEKISAAAEKALYSPKIMEKEIEEAKKAMEELKIIYAAIVH
ncbi:MAG: hypothetical protein N3F64_02870 [Nitrososphaeria archaeon]|nr:hypothetical protein [Nitrososphaeria archaeon]